MRHARGFTLWELICTLGIAAVTLGAGVPAFRTVLLDARLTADVNAWVLAVQLARSEAFKRGRPVVVCKTDDTHRCGAGVPADAGFMVYVNLDDEYPLGFKVALHRKDLGIALDLAAQLGAVLPVSALAAQFETGLISGGHGDEDMSALARTIRGLSGLGQPAPPRPEDD